MKEMKEMKMIYLDYAATTPVDPRVAEKMWQYLIADGEFANAASLHGPGKKAHAAIEHAREQVAALLNADASEIIWTSGATESDNLAIKGAVHLYERRGKHIITAKTEHKAVLESCQQLEKEGYAVTYLMPEKNGVISIEQIKAALRDDTLLISIMNVNNETGVMQDIDAIATLTKEHGILFHVDATQAIGKIAIDVKKTPIDLLSLSAHKVYGPKGIGALYLRKKPRIRVEPFIHGGGHEQGMRSGTLATHQIVGLGEALAIAQEEMQSDYQRITKLREDFIQALRSIPNFHLNSELSVSVPHIINVRFDNMLADAILEKLPMIAASTASACQGKGTEGSYVLRAMGYSDAEVKASIRFSLGKFTTEEEIKHATCAILAIF
jgi:cysteine desulfurase